MAFPLLRLQFHPCNLFNRGTCWSNSHGIASLGMNCEVQAGKEIIVRHTDDLTGQTSFMGDINSKAMHICRMTDANANPEFSSNLLSQHK